MDLVIYSLFCLFTLYIFLPLDLDVLLMFWDNVISPYSLQWLGVQVWAKPGLNVIVFLFRFLSAGITAMTSSTKHCGSIFIPVLHCFYYYSFVFSSQILLHIPFHSIWLTLLWVFEHIFFISKKNLELFLVQWRVTIVFDKEFH